MMVVQLRATHPTQTRFAHVTCATRTHVSRWWHPCWTSRARHLWSSRLNCLAIVDLSHSAHAPAPQSWILIAVSPGINGSLNKTPLTPEARVQFSQGPTDSVALSLVHQAIASVLILAAASTWIDAVLRFKFRAQCLHIDRFHVAPDGILHLYAIAGIFESNPLDAIVVLSDNQWSRCWNWTRRSIWVHTWTTRYVILLHLSAICWMLGRSQRRSWPVHLGNVWFHFCSRAACNGLLLRMVLWVLLLHRVLTGSLRHKEIWLRSHRWMMLLLLWVWRIRRWTILRRHRRRVLLLLRSRIVHLRILR